MQPAGVKRCRGDNSLRAAGAPPITFYVNGAAAEWRSFTWPLTDLVDVLRLLDCVWIAPTDLVGFEFSGAMRTALERQGRLALSVDLRHSERKGMHAQLDARLVMHLKRWERAYLFPPCFQQLRADEHCLPAKIADGRAYFGCATVALCCCVDAEIIVVEQPDTIFFDVCDIPSTSFRTSQFGDSPDKFVRLVVRGAHLHVPGVATHHPCGIQTVPNSTIAQTTSGTAPAARGSASTTSPAASPALRRHLSWLARRCCTQSSSGTWQPLGMLKAGQYRPATTILSPWPCQPPTALTSGGEAQATAGAWSASNLTCPYRHRYSSARHSRQPWWCLPSPAAAQ